MWCPKCQADVAAIASADNQSAACSACGAQLLVAPTEHPHGPVSRDPRELLARWAQEDALTPLPTLPPIGEASAARGTGSGRYDRLKRDSQQLRFDAQHPIGRGTQSPSPAEHVPAALIQGSAAPPPTHTTPTYVATDEPGRDMVIHPPHALAGTPHFEAEPLVARKKKTPTRWVTLAGQLAAYLGVGTLTVGASMVLMAYFGGPEHYAPTGWLITTAGQMLLFLGVVTLISGGMEQTTQEVAERIDSLGAKIIRLEEYRAAKAGKDSSTDAA